MNFAKLTQILSLPAYAGLSISAAEQAGLGIVNAGDIQSTGVI